MPSSPMTRCSIVLAVAKAPTVLGNGCKSAPITAQKAIVRPSSKSRELCYEL